MMVAVIDKQTYGYDIEKNEWQNLNSEIPFKASDSSSVFAWDTAAGRFIVANINEGRIAVLDMEGHKWDEIKPNGPGIPKAQYGTGKGYYDPLYNVLVIQRSSSDKMWVYRHAAGQ